ncbi:MAG TPA: hypothetical protein VK173_10605, partial [Lacibacter sp.]|nr:hypothetical protein [Lacibacter sp.]
MKPLHLLFAMLLGTIANAQVKILQVINGTNHTAYYGKEKGAGGSYFNDENETHATVMLGLQGTCQSPPTVQASAYFFNDFPRFGALDFKPYYVNPGSVEFGALQIVAPDSRNFLQQLDSLPP